MKHLTEQHGEVTISANDTIQSIALHRKGTLFNKLFIYPFKSINNGKGVDNDLDIWLGKAGDGRPMTPDILSPGDSPFLVEVPDGYQMRLEDILIQGTAGDGAFYTFWTYESYNLSGPPPTILDSDIVADQ